MMEAVRVNSGKIFFGIAFLGLLLAFAGLASAANDVYSINVSLGGPANGNWNSSVSGLNFTFTPIWTAGILGTCELWTNATGTWALSSTNQTSMANATSNGIYNYTIPANGTIIWNVRCASSNGTYSNFTSNGSVYNNYTLNFDSSQPIVTITSPSNNSYANLTTTYGGGIGNMTFAVYITGINATYGSNQVNCSVKMNATGNHTNSALTGYGSTRIEYLQIPANSTTRFNVSCSTPALVGAYNDTIYVGGIYYSPLVKLVTPANGTWIGNATYTVLNYTTNHTLVTTYNNSNYLTCYLYLNTTLNQTNTTVYPNTDNMTWTLSVGGDTDGWWQYNISCKDIAGNIGYNDSWFIGLDGLMTGLYYQYPTPASSSRHLLDNCFFNISFTETYPDTCLLDYTYPNATHTNLTMTKASGTPLYCYLNITSQSVGTAVFKIYLNDTHANWNTLASRTYYPVSSLGDTNGGTGTGGVTPTPAATPTATPAATPAPTYGATATPRATTPASTSTPTIEGTATPAPTEAPAEGVSQVSAQKELSVANEYLAQAQAKKVDVSEANRLLNLAQQALNSGQYEVARDYSLQAQTLLKNSIAKASGTTTAKAAGVDLTLVAIIVVLVLIGAGYLYYTRNKRKGL